MNEIEDRLRDAFRADAETVSQRSLPGLPPLAIRSRRRSATARRARILIPLAAAAAVIAVIVAATTLSPLGPGGVGASLPAGVPRFYVASSAYWGIPFIHSTATGQVTGTLRPPRGQRVTFLAPLAGDDSYMALVEPRQGLHGAARIEQFSISSSGQPSALRPAGITIPFEISQFAVTPDGHTIAFYGRDRIDVVNRITGQSRTWTGCCQPISQSPFTLSLSASGRQLVAAPLDKQLRDNMSGVQLLRINSPPGSIGKHSRLVLPNAFFATLSPSGSTLYACLARYGVYRTTWVAYTVATGRRRTIAQWRGRAQGGISGCWTLTASASSRYVLDIPAGHHSEALDTRTGRVIPLPHIIAGANKYVYW